MLLDKDATCFYDKLTTKFGHQVKQVTFSGLGANLSTVIGFLEAFPNLRRFTLDGVDMRFDGGPFDGVGVPLLSWLSSDLTCLGLPQLRGMTVQNCVLDMGALLVLLQHLGSLVELSIQGDVLDEYFGPRRAGLEGMAEDHLTKLPRAFQDVRKLHLVNSVGAAYSIMTANATGLVWMAIRGLQTLTLSLYARPSDSILGDLVSRNANSLEELTVYAQGTSEFGWGHEAMSSPCQQDMKCGGVGRGEHH